MQWIYIHTHTINRSNHIWYKQKNPLMTTLQSLNTYTSFYHTTHLHE